MKKYNVVEQWDGGNAYTFLTYDKAKAKAEEITREPKWTAWELEQYKSKGENYVSIFEVETDDDGYAYEIEYNEVETLVIDEKTLFRIYEG